MGNRRSLGGIAGRAGSQRGVGRLSFLRAPAAFALSFAVVIVAMFVASLATGGGGGGDAPPRPKSAAVVDQLSLTFPNPDFVKAATEILGRAGYAVDYFPGEQVTVDFYRNLAKRGYGIIVLRSHSGPLRSDDLQTVTDDLGLFTSEPLDSSSPGPAVYWEELRERRLAAARYVGQTAEFVAVAAGFVESSMKGQFDGPVIIMMGCDGLRSQRMARAFVDRGASAFVSWTKPVSASHTDAATVRLLNLIAHGVPVAQAVAETAAEVGPDPEYGAELRVLLRDQ